MQDGATTKGDGQLASKAIVAGRPTGPRLILRLHVVPRTGRVGIAVDGSGNVYTTGQFSGAADFDPGVGVFNLTAFGSRDIVVSKLGSAGSFVWARQMGGMGSTNSGIGSGIAVDGSGDIHTTGHFWGTADFDPGVGVSNLTSLGVEDVFVSKLADPSTISVSATQSSPGAPFFLNNFNLTPGNEYYNIFSLDPCSGGSGTGPVASFGACVFTPANLTFVTNQLISPVGTQPFHIIAPSSYSNWGPFSVGPVTVDAICVDVTGGVIGATSSVSRITVQ